MDQIGPMQFYKLKLLFINEAGVPVAAKLQDVNSNLIIQLLAFSYVIFTMIERIILKLIKSCNY